MALPGALAGVLWMLFVDPDQHLDPGAAWARSCASASPPATRSWSSSSRTSSGAEAGLDAHDAALAAGTTRLRPVLMTALAMILGMLPMALGLGEGGEQNAPLGRVVIGGLTLATFATLVFVPVVHSVLRRKAAVNERPAELRE